MRVFFGINRILVEVEQVRGSPGSGGKSCLWSITAWSLEGAEVKNSKKGRGAIVIGQVLFL